jgi:hypothetical protein
MLTATVEQRGGNALNHRNVTKGRDSIEIWTNIETSNVAFDHFPPISFSAMLSGNFKDIVSDEESDGRTVGIPSLCRLSQLNSSLRISKLLLEPLLSARLKLVA